MKTLINQTLTERLEESNLFGALLKVLKYGLYIYNQASPISDKEGEFLIRYPYSELPKNSLLFVLPTNNSIAYDNSGETVKKNTLRIKFAYNDDDGNVRYGNDKYYDILVEQSNGLKKYAGEGHIVANRLAIFRVGDVDDNTITLTNSPIYNEINVASILVTDDATFYSTPKVKLPKKNETDPDKAVSLVRSDELAELEARVEFLEDRIQIGTTDAEEALAGYPDGTLYVKVDT